jgi:hypothetical protein
MSIPNRPALSVRAATSGMRARVAKKPAADTRADTATARWVAWSRMEAAGTRTAAAAARASRVTAVGRGRRDTLAAGSSAAARGRDWDRPERRGVALGEAAMMV